MKQRNMDRKKTGKILVEAGFLFIVIGLLCAFGIRQSAAQDFKITLGGLNFPQAFIKSDGNYKIIYLNQESLYTSFLSVLFSFLGNKEEVVSIINLILQVLGVIFFYLGAKRLFHHVFPITIAVISALLSACFSPVIADNSMHIIWLLSAFMFLISTGSLLGKHIITIFCGILLGIFCYIDLMGVVLLITYILLILMTKELRFKGKKMPFISFIYFLLGNITGYFIMFLLWNDFRFDFIVLGKWFQDKILFCNSADKINQIFSIITIWGITIISYFIVSIKKKNVIDAENTADLKVVEKAEDNVVNTVIEEISLKTDTIETNSVEQPKPIKFIENPLPLPKKHVKKEMNYAFEPTQDQMHYDLNNYRIDDDYDLKDI